MFQKIATVGTVCSAVFALIISFYLNNNSPDGELQIRLKDVLQGLIKVESRFKSETPKVAVGYGACNDLFVGATEFLDYDEFIEPEHFDDINSIEELKRSFAYFFQHGAAAE